MKFYPRRSRAGLAAAANVSAMRFSRLGVAAAFPGGGGPAQMPSSCGRSFSVAARQLNFCSCFGTTHFDLRRAKRGLSSAHRGWVHFIFIDFRTRRAAARQCLRLFGFVLPYRDWRLLRRLPEESPADCRRAGSQEGALRALAGVNCVFLMNPCRTISIPSK